jgi:hypothetical protein
MRAIEAGKMFGGSVAIYVIMAACSAGSGPSNGATSQDGGHSSSGSGSGSGGVSSSSGSIADGSGSSGADGSESGSGASSSGGSIADGSGSGSDGPSIMDVLTDPVPEAAADPNQSGTRLKVNYYAGTDGSKQSADSMHDTMLNIDCSFRTMSDGTLRCAPIGGASGVGFYFADSACSQQLAMAASGCTPTNAYANVTSSTCGGYLAVYTLSGAYSGASYYLKSGTNCLGPTSTSGSTFYTVGAEQPPSTFVQATMQMEP